MFAPNDDPKKKPGKKGKKGKKDDESADSPRPPNMPPSAPVSDVSDSFYLRCNCFLTDDDSRSFCGQCRSRSDCTMSQTCYVLKK